MGDLVFATYVPKTKSIGAFPKRHFDATHSNQSTPSLASTPPRAATDRQKSDICARTVDARRCHLTHRISGLQ
jgi:hypothetical protein